MKSYDELKGKIRNKKAIITVIGLGYVGLPMALEFARKGFCVNGFDLNVRRIRQLKKGISYINDISDKEIKDVFGKNKFHVTADEKIIKKSDAIIICVPTPLRKIKEPDISFVLAVSKTVCKYMKTGQAIILESTTYPGTTRDVILPILKKSKLSLGEDFFLAFSPERIDPGNGKYDFTNIPKVMGGMTEKCTDISKLLYSNVVKKVVGVSTPEIAEVTKLLENTFRIVNIGLINEFATLCYKLGIDVWEVIKAAETKPFGFMPFYPGPGIGGHCIPADPMYLSWKARKVGFETKMVDLAAQLNRRVPNKMVKRIEKILKKKKISIKKAKVFISGITYKKDVNDLRESPALEIIEGLRRKNMDVSYNDPYIPYLDLDGIKAKSKKITQNLLKKQDIVVVVTDHSNVNYEFIAKNADLIFDTRNIFERKGIKSKNIITL